MTEVFISGVLILAFILGVITGSRGAEYHIRKEVKLLCAEAKASPKCEDVLLRNLGLKQKNRL